MLNMGPPTVSFPDTTPPHFLADEHDPFRSTVPMKDEIVSKGFLNAEDKCNSSWNERQPCAYIQGCIRGHAFYLLKC